MPRKTLPIILSESETIRLEQWIRSGSTPQQVVLRCRIIQAAVFGLQDRQMALLLKVRRRTAARWCQRVREQGIGCVWGGIAPGCGRKARLSAVKVAELVAATLHTRP